MPLDTVPTRDECLLEPSGLVPYDGPGRGMSLLPGGSITESRFERQMALFYEARAESSRWESKKVSSAQYEA